jgi:SAM-dependent methyltransferase
MSESAKENWSSGSAYEGYVGRWSRRVAEDFVDWLAVGPGLAWADVGCGTGAMTSCILQKAEPTSVRAIDRSDAYLAEARARLPDGRAQFQIGDACALPWDTGAVDVGVSGLVLNFVADVDAMAREMRRITRPGGKVGLYVWDYADGMQMMRHFWDVVAEQFPGSGLDEAERFPLCQPAPLQALLERSGFESVTVQAIEIPTIFRDFDDYWQPFTSRQGPAPAYLASLPDDRQAAIRNALRARLVAASDGSLRRMARAWAVQGTVPRAVPRVAWTTIS